MSGRRTAQCIATMTGFHTVARGHRAEKEWRPHWQWIIRRLADMGGDEQRARARGKVESVRVALVYIVHESKHAIV